MYIHGWSVCLERDSRLDESAMNGNDSWEELMGMGRLNERSEGSKQGRFIVLLSCYLVVRCKLI